MGFWADWRRERGGDSHSSPCFLTSSNHVTSCLTILLPGLKLLLHCLPHHDSLSPQKEIKWLLTPQALDTTVGKVINVRLKILKLIRNFWGEVTLLDLSASWPWKLDIWFSLIFTQALTILVMRLPWLRHAGLRTTVCSLIQQITLGAHCFFGLLSRVCIHLFKSLHEKSE